MRIGQLARQAYCSTETIRFYEKEGLLPEPARTAGNYRHYTAVHLERLRFIRNCRSLDMTHAEIRALLECIDDAATSASCAPVNNLLDEHIGHVDIRLAELEQLREQLVALRQRCGHARPLPDCGILQGLNDMETEEIQPSASHLS